jgi:hypothetical protein
VALTAKITLIDVLGQGVFSSLCHQTEALSRKQQQFEKTVKQFT